MITLDVSSLLTYIGGIGVIGVTIWAGIKYLSKSYVDQYFKEELEAYKHDLQQLLELKKHELQQVSEINKFDLQRKMSDFNLFTPKKHSIYAELYGLYLKAEEIPRGLMGIRQLPNYLAYNANELEYSLKNLGVPEIKIHQFTEEWDKYKSTKIEDLRAYIQFFEIHQAKIAFWEARDKFRTSKLYLSDKVSAVCEELTKTIWHLIVDIECIFDKEFDIKEKHEYRRSFQENQKKITDLMEELLTEMKLEISIGYYQSDLEH